MAAHARFLVSSLLAASLAASHLAPALAATDALSKTDYEACQSRDESTFRASLETITQDALKRSMATFSYPNAVGQSWRTAGLDDTIDKAVDLAVADVGKSTSWGDLLQSLADSKKSQELAKAVAERVYNSEPVKKGLEAVVGDVSRSLGQTLEFASQDAAGPAGACVKAFLSQRYGSAVSSAVTGQVDREFNGEAVKGQATVSSGSVIAKSSDGITGAAILLVRRQLANMAARVGQRIVGSILSRLVSVAAGGVGAILIAKDIWDLRSGVLPIIATEMKSKSTKDQVQAELAKSIAEQIGDHVKDVGSKSAQRIFEIWQEFRRAHAKTLEIADRSEVFRTFLDQTLPANLPRLDEVVAILLTSEGEPAILKRLADGTLNTAVNTLSTPGMDIARDTASLDQGLKWSAVAGELLPKVQEFELHKRAAADTFTKVSLGRLIALDDKLAVSRLASLTRDSRDTILDLGPADAKLLGRALTEAELGTLSNYMTGLQKKPRERLLREIAGSPGKMRLLASSRVRDAVLASRDQATAVDIMLRADAGGPQVMMSDAKLAWDGQISPVLIWERHPLAIAAAIIPALVLLMLVFRIFGGRRKTPRPPAQTA
jgi:hypothetical protein